MKKDKTPVKYKAAKILIAGVVLLIMAFGAFIIPLRPTVSYTEKRKLAEFPDFSFASLSDGSYFSDIALWFSDTVPFRDELVAINSKIQNFFGTSYALAGFNEGVKGDDIPDAPLSQPDTLPASEGDTTSAPENTTSAVEQSTGALPDNIQTLGSIIICGDAGYEFYNFVQTTADGYVTAVNRAASLLAGKATIYNMIVPTSIDITLDKRIRNTLSVSDQQKAIEYITGSLNTSVNTVKLFDVLSSHKDEYIYFRTDHHWTALGAYYAYREYCAAKGFTPLELNAYTLRSFDGFLGSFYNDSGMNADLTKNPDIVDTYNPPCNTKMTVTTSSGENITTPMIYDATNSKAAYKYSTFIFGDNPFTVIENTDMAEGKSCLVIKESFGNCFVPFLTYHYKYVYVVDYRYFSGSLSDTVSRYGINDVVFCNNISMTRSENNVSKLKTFIG